MWTTLLRLGLYLILLTLAAYVVRERSPLVAGTATDEVLEFGLKAGGVLLIFAALARLVHRSTPRPTGRCAVCRAKVSRNEIYCRTHLANLIEREDERSRSSTHKN